MVIQPWGTDWTYSYKPQVGGKYVTPAGSPAIYVFQDQPSEAAARAGTGALLSPITSWTYSQATNKATFTVPKIADPADGTRKRQYWIAINYAVGTGGASDKNLDLRPFYLMRPDGMDEEAIPSADEFFDEFDSTLGKRYDLQAIGKFIERAERTVKLKLNWEGHRWERIENIGDVREAIGQLTLVFAYIPLIDQEGDIWREKLSLAKEHYDDLMKLLVPLKGDDYSQTADPEVEPSRPKALFLTR